MLPFHVVVKPQRRLDPAAAHPHPNSFSITLIQLLSFLRFTDSSAPQTRPIYFSFNHLHTLSTATEGVGGTPPPRRSNVARFKCFSVVHALSPNPYPLSHALTCYQFCKSFIFMFIYLRGGVYRGTPLSGVQPFRGDCHAPNQSPVTSHQSPLWPSVPLQPNALGATIGNGT